MTILVVEDHEALRQLLAELIKNHCDKTAVEVLQAGTLDEARELLPQADAVLSDGSFPTHTRRFEEAGDRACMNTNWSSLMTDCEAVGIPFVLLSGQPALVTRLKQNGYAAYRKPGDCNEAVKSVVLAAELKWLNVQFGDPKEGSGSTQI